MRRLSAELQPKQDYLNGYYTSLRKYKLSDKDKREEIETQISALADTDERELLRLRYIKNKSMESVSRSMHISRATAYRIHKDALKHLQLPMQQCGQ